MGPHPESSQHQKVILCLAWLLCLANLVDTPDAFVNYLADKRTNTHTHTYTHQRYIVGKVHCGENPCVLGGRCGERTHICTNDTLWGKCIVGKICAS